MRRRLIGNGIVLLLGIVLVAAVATRVQACGNSQQSCSSGYGVSEAFFGNGGSLDSTCSTSYCAKQSAGETGVGNTASTNYQAQAGFDTNRAPYLELTITGGASADLGYLSTGSTKTTTTTFQVKSYLANSYAVKIVGSPPTNNGASPHTLAALTGGGSSTPGTEQFGINLVHNTSPAIGSDPSQLPDTSFGFGTAASGYSTANTFKYNNGDIIAQSAKSSGYTQYVMSFIYNISSLTADGQYTYNGSLVATSTF